MKKKSERRESKESVRDKINKIKWEDKADRRDWKDRDIVNV